MKIMQINKFFFPKGGAEKYFFDLSELLEKKGHQVIPWSTRHFKNFPWDNQKDFVSFNDFSKKEGFFKDLKKVFRIFYNPEALNKLEKILDREEPDLVHCHNIFKHLSPKFIDLVKKRNIPVVMTLHDYQLFCPNYKFFSQGKPCYECLKQNNFSPCLKKKCVRNSFLPSLVAYLEANWQKKYLKLTEKIDAFITPSQFVYQKAIEAGISEDKLYHLPNFTEKADLSALPEIRAKKNNPYLFYFGRLSQEKGVDILIKAFLKIAKDYPEWQLKIAGDGPQHNQLVKLVGKRNNIEFVGSLTKNTLRDTIAKSRFCVVPSVWPENFPYSILESFLLKRPVIASRIGGLPEIVIDQKTGLLSEAGNIKQLAEKIEWAMKNPQKMRKMGQNSRDYVLLNLNPESHYRAIKKIYDRIKNN